MSSKLSWNCQWYCGCFCCCSYLAALQLPRRPEPTPAIFIPPIAESEDGSSSLRGRVSVGNPLNRAPSPMTMSYSIETPERQALSAPGSAGNTPLHEGLQGNLPESEEIVCEPASSPTAALREQQAALAQDNTIFGMLRSLNSN